MLDRLLGRAGLKDRIGELEEELRHCERQLEAEQERRADATSAKQAAEERTNRLEDRIADLEGTVERLREEGHEGDRAGSGASAVEALVGERRGAVLDRLASFETGPEGTFTAYVPDDDLSETVRSAFGDRASAVAGAAPCLAITDDAGLVSACLSVPDSPEPFETWTDGVRFERSWFEPTGSYTVALVRSDLFAMGEYDGRERVAFHGFDRELTRNHSKGGFSQSRFERLRDEQIDDHLDRCRAAIDERDTDRLYLVGERTVLDDIDAEANAVAAVDATGDPEPALDDAVHEFWTVRLRTP
jgi:peptide subunit release factor 1 (eRF1)